MSTQSIPDSSSNKRIEAYDNKIHKLSWLGGLCLLATLGYVIFASMTCWNSTGNLATNGWKIASYAVPAATGGTVIACLIANKYFSHKIAQLEEPD